MKGLESISDSGPFFGGKPMPLFAHLAELENLSDADLCNCTKFL
jgi:hypothetical protein